MNASLVRLTLCLLLLCSAQYVLASTDLLAGTLGDVHATMEGTGRRWIFLIEGVSALIAYRSTKNIYVLGSVIAVALFINVLLMIAQ